MKTEISAGGVLAITAVVVGGFLAWKAYQLAKGAGGAVVDAAGRVITRDLNPTSSENIVNRGVNAAGEAITGEQGWSLGGAIFDLLHPDAFRNDPTPYQTPDQIAAARLAYDRPIDYGNPSGDPDGW